MTTKNKYMLQNNDGQICEKKTQKTLQNNKKKERSEFKACYQAKLSDA